MITLIFQIFLQYQKYNVPFPLGWDPILNVGLSRTMLKEGILDFVVTERSPVFYTMASASLVLLVRDANLVEKTFPIALTFILIYIFFLIALRISHSTTTAIVASIFAAFGVNTVYMSAELHRQLLAYVLFLYVLLSLRNFPQTKTVRNGKFLLPLLASVLIGWTQIDTYVLLLTTLVILSGVLAFHRTGLLKFLALSSVVTMSPLLVLNFPMQSVVGGYFRMAQEGLQQTVLDAPTFVNNTGGNAILAILSFVGLLSLLGRFHFYGDVDSLVFFVFGCELIGFSLLTHFGFPVPAYRILLVFPAPLYIALSLHPSFQRTFLSMFPVFSMKTYKQSAQKDILAQNLKLGTSTISISHRKPWSVFLTVILILASLGSLVAVFYDYRNRLLRTYIDPDDYQRILDLKEVYEELSLSKPPIFMFYGNRSLKLTHLWRAFIYMEIGRNFGYYGTLEDFIQGAPPSMRHFNSDPNKERLLAETLNEDLLLRAYSFAPSIADLPVILVESFYEAEVPTIFSNHQILKGIYVIYPLK